jgi:hypothetical protein
LRVQPITLDPLETALFVALCIVIFIIADIIETCQRDIQKVIIGFKIYFGPKCRKYDSWIGMHFWSIYPNLELDLDNLIIPMKRERETIF